MLRRIFSALLVWAVSASSYAIVYGDEVEQLEFDADYSYMVSVRASFEAEDHKCGGVVLNERWILTAAHCLINSSTSLEGEPNNQESFTTYEVVKPKEISVTVGTADLAAVGFSNIYNITHIVIHPQYDPLHSVETDEAGNVTVTTAFQHDLALLYSERDLPEVAVDILPNDEDYAALQLLEQEWDDANPPFNLTVAGWGTGGDTTLNETSVAYISNELCYQRLESAEDYPRYIASPDDPTKICTLPTTVETIGDQIWGNGACIGDTGGPLVKDGVLVGIISASPIIYDVCSSVTLPTWYSNVHHYLDWLNVHKNMEEPPEKVISLPDFLVEKSVSEMEEEYPYVVSIRASFEAEQHKCSGMILSKRWILTAAHCLVQSGTSLEGDPGNPESFTQFEVVKPKEIAVTAGTADLAAAKLSNVYNITHIVIHPQYDPIHSVEVDEFGDTVVTTAFQNDLALLYSERDLPDTIAPLINDSTLHAELLQLDLQWDPANPVANLQVAGWRINGQEDTILKETGVAYISNELCYQRLETAEKYPRYIASPDDPMKICSLPTISETNGGDTIVGNGACTGDTGGPLVKDGVVVGVMSASPLIDRICSSVTLPTWYSDVYYYLDWLKSYFDSEEAPDVVISFPEFLLQQSNPVGEEEGVTDEEITEEVIGDTCDTPATVTIGGSTAEVGCYSDSSGGSLSLFWILGLLMSSVLRRRDFQLEE
ncbi:S1 family peptidase [Vibrio hangzhouensis]|uniref:Secreted trypsin-like serine protease n=1 Tax=Vibrio hangzhouensis TaxID=462991 RepID=A0A1H5XYX6_9VIBR|nr:trypsin-like serine protease [Vibrio hangzhouensis]SEG16974.1 Secreted trypsin-like serine protease [Vibrio hangzhouensis]